MLFLFCCYTTIVVGDRMREFVSNLKGVWKYIKSDKKSLIILIFEHILQIGISIVLPILSAKYLLNLLLMNI